MTAAYLRCDLSFSFKGVGIDIGETPNVKIMARNGFVHLTLLFTHGTKEHNDFLRSQKNTDFQDAKNVREQNVFRRLPCDRLCTKINNKKIQFEIIIIS